MVDTAHLNPELNAKVQQLIALSGGRVSVASGFRSFAQQTALWNASDKSGKMVARPGHSNHERGLAVDLSGDLALARRLAVQVGLVTPMSYEPWHFELPGTRAVASPHAYTPDPAKALPTAPVAQSAPAVNLNAQLDDILAHPFNFAEDSTSKSSKPPANETVI